MIDVNKLPKKFGNHEIAHRIPHSLKHEPIMMEAGHNGYARLLERAFVWNADKPFEIYSLAVKMYGCDVKGRVLDQQPKVLPFFVRLRAHASSISTSLGELRPTQDDATPNTVVYHLPMPLTLSRSEGFEITVDSLVKEWDVVMSLSSPKEERLGTQNVLSLGGIRLEPFLEGAMLVLLPNHSA